MLPLAPTVCLLVSIIIQIFKEWERGFGGWFEAKAGGKRAGLLRTRAKRSAAPSRLTGKNAAEPARTRVAWTDTLGGARRALCAIRRRRWAEEDAGDRAAAGSHRLWVIRAI